MISYCLTPTARWQICIPTKQLITLVRWFHEVLGHCGIHRLCDSMVTQFSHPRLRATVNDVIKHCRAGVRYNTIPLTADAGKWAGQPIAFICANFTFYTAAHQTVQFLDLSRATETTALFPSTFVSVLTKAPLISVCESFAILKTQSWIQSMQRSPAFIEQIC
jgi:hypothetical protein